jgi:sucrose phosphorylase
MSIKNEVMLITYADSLGRNLKELKQVLNKHLHGVIGGIHILPFYPSSGDRGFAPLTYQEVDESFGDWDDIREIASEYYFMTDFMINHISQQSAYFQDFLKYHEASGWKDLFIRCREFWKEGEPTQKELDRIYKRKPKEPFFLARFEDGSEEKVWCTFDEQQIDLDVTADKTKNFIRENLKFLVEKGADIIRLDAFAYANKKANTNCFFVEPEIWQTLQECSDMVGDQGTVLLPEIHEHYTIQQKIADQGYYVYDFALPMLMLYTMYSGKVTPLAHWLKICPHKQFTTLDTHDGIGVVDVRDLLSEEETEYVIEKLYEQGANTKRIYSSEAYNNLDIYQINTTYYSALGDDDEAYYISRLIQCFAPGIPQIYYVGLLAGTNDIKLLEETKEGRNINRHYYTLEEIDAEVKRPIVKRLFSLFRFRNQNKAFCGSSQVQIVGDHEIKIIRESEDQISRVELYVNASEKTYQVTSIEGDHVEEVLL